MIPTQAISEFCRTGSGTTPSRSNEARYYGGNIQWVKSGELRETEIFDTEEKVTEAALAETSLKLVPANSLLVAMYGATVGRVGMLRVPATTNQAVCHIIPDPAKADTRYMFHALQWLAPQFVNRGVGGAQPNISQKIVQDAQVRLPPLSEQRRIAAILDQADALLRKQQGALQLLENLGAALIRQLTRNASKQSGKVYPISEVVECLDRLRRPIKESERAKGNVPYYGANGLQGYIDRALFDEDLVLVAEDGGHFDEPGRGVAYKISGPAWVNNHAHILRPKGSPLNNRVKFATDREESRERDS